MHTQLTRDDLIMVAKRENNQKRSFLYVDPLQGKHVPVSPTRALQTMELLALRVSEQYSGETLLVIGFAETATAIGAALALSCPQVRAFLTTTREGLGDAEYLIFSESHSHATEQRLYVQGLEEWLRCTDRVVFAEDEVTTGNTIGKLIAALRARFPEIGMRFGIASLLNSMTEERLADFRAQGIPCTCLFHIPFGYRIGETERFAYETPRTSPFLPERLQSVLQTVPHAWNPRRAGSVQSIADSCERFAQSALQMLSDCKPEMQILVLGTEECMYPGLFLGRTLERMGHQVWFHATTRSPIETSKDAAYPLHSRALLRSLYDEERTTYVYDLRRYDKVIIVTDAPAPSPAGLATLTGALEQCGNTDVTVLQWEETER